MPLKLPKTTPETGTSKERQPHILFWNTCSGRRTVEQSQKLCLSTPDVGQAKATYQADQFFLAGSCSLTSQTVLLHFWRALL